MKILFSLLAILMFNKECDRNKTTDIKTTAINSEKTSGISQDVSTISYEATTRGFYEKIWINKETMTITNDRNHMESTSFPTPESDWNELLELIKDVDITALPDIEAPTSKRQYDGAAFATLTVTQGKLETRSNSFDHGHPPKAIEAVVNKVLSMKKMHEKN
ncbi:MAG: hypothetical protein R2783_10040 [Gelidibacter sp.]